MARTPMVTVLVAALTVSGCGTGATTPAAAPATNAATSAAASDTAAVCARWQEAQLPFLLNTAPEAKAYARMAGSYFGAPAARIDSVAGADSTPARRSYGRQRPEWSSRPGRPAGFPAGLDLHPAGGPTVGR